MTPEDWQLLKLLPPSKNHDAFHEFMDMDGRLTPKGRAIRKLAAAIGEEGVRRFEIYAAGKSNVD